MDLQRVLGVFERNYGLRSDDFYRAHISNDSVATDLPAWHREVWAGTYRRLLDLRPAADSGPARPPRDRATSRAEARRWRRLCFRSMSRRPALRHARS